jgi:hypothetical protein
MKRRRASTMLSVRESVPCIIPHLGNRPQGQSNWPQEPHLTQARGILPAPGRERALVGNTAPTAVINTPAAGTTWKVGDVINFSGGATDAQDGALRPSALSWELILQHCPSNWPLAYGADLRRRG